METKNFDFAGTLTHNMHDIHSLNSVHSSARPDGDDDDDDKDDDEENTKTSDSDEDPEIDQKVVHSPLPTDNGGKPKS